MKNIILFALFALSILVNSCDLPGVPTDFDVPGTRTGQVLVPLNPGTVEVPDPNVARTLIEGNQARIASVDYSVHTNNDVDTYIVNDSYLEFNTSQQALGFNMRDVVWQVWHEGLNDTITTTGFQSTFTPNGIDDIRVRCQVIKGTVANPQPVTSLMSMMVIPE